jgi:hypothetical protein
MTYESSKLTSLVDTPDVSTILSNILVFFDPYKYSNTKTRILDMSNAFNWPEKSNHMYSVVQTHNISGSAKDLRYNVIIYEPPRNKTFGASLEKHVNVFKDLLYDHGVIIVKMRDFRLDDELKGSFDITQEFSKHFRLCDNIVYKNPHSYRVERIDNNYSKIIHSNVLVFKKN